MRNKLSAACVARTALVATAILAATAAPAIAQDRFELTGIFGYTFGEGIDVGRGSDVGSFIDRLGVDDGISYGGAINVWVNDMTQVGFQFDLHDSALRAEGSSTDAVTSMNVYGFHGTATWHGGSMSSTVRPFLLIGLGATHYSPSDLANVSFDGETQFSGTVGLGVKKYVNERVGVAFTGRWTPTYIKSDTEGLYCSAYWTPWYGSGCVVIPDPDYSNQFELTAGIFYRF